MDNSRRFPVLAMKLVSTSTGQRAQASKRRGSPKAKSQTTKWGFDGEPLTAGRPRSPGKPQPTIISSPVKTNVSTMPFSRGPRILQKDGFQPGLVSGGTCANTSCVC